MEPLFAARLQMAFTLGWHIIVACFGVGLPVLLLFAELRFLQTGDTSWKVLAQRWAKAFAVLFAIGAVSGTVLSFELGLLWPKFMGTFGSVIGLPFTLEAFAFFVEAIFVGIYLYAWDRLPPRVHWFCGLPIAISGFASAWFVVTANAWMNAPQGFTLSAEGIVTSTDPIAAMFNRSTWMQTTHMICAAYMVSGFVVASYYAVLYLRGNTSVYVRRAMTAGFVLGACIAPLQIVVGDWAAKVVAQTQPIKLAAMEGQFITEAYAPLRIGGIPDHSAGVTRYSIEIPGGLSFLAYGDTSAVVKGLNDFPAELRPPAAVVHIAFQIMVATGSFLAALACWGGVSLIRSRSLPTQRLFLYLLILSGPAAILALEAGWTVTEVGRQPWIVQGYMKTADAVTTAPGITLVFAVTLGLYALLTLGAVVVLTQLARKPMHEAPYES